MADLPLCTCGHVHAGHTSLPNHTPICINCWRLPVAQRCTGYHPAVRQQ